MIRITTKSVELIQEVMSGCIKMNEDFSQKFISVISLFRRYEERWNSEIDKQLGVLRLGTIPHTDQRLSIQREKTGIRFDRPSFKAFLEIEPEVLCLTIETCSDQEKVRIISVTISQDLDALTVWAQEELRKKVALERDCKMAEMQVQMLRATVQDEQEWSRLMAQLKR